MNIYETIFSLKQNIPEFISSYCIINGDIVRLDEIEQISYEEFNICSKINMPNKLYKYFPNQANNEENINYSIEALENNTVFMQSPNEFDDIYDSDINLDFQKYERLRLIEYCNRCNIKINKTLSTSDIGNKLIQKLITTFSEFENFNYAFKNETKSELDPSSNSLNTVFSLKLRLALTKNNDIAQALANVIYSDFNDYASKLKNTFRTTCFTTTPYSQLMWGAAYANYHQGFCLEYTILPNKNEYQDLYKNLFPMIYCKTRTDITEQLTKLQDTSFNKEKLWYIYLHGVLRKSFDWAFQNEWRLLLPMKFKNINDYNIKFFPITKVFLGARMNLKERKEIIDICHNKNIPYVAVTRNPNIFEMQDSKIKCEDCFKYKKIL